MNTQIAKLPPFDEIRRNIVLAIVLSIITFGIYYFFWQYHQMKCMNRLLGQNKYSFFMWFVLSFVTLGLYHIYYEYVMGSDLVLIQKKYGRTQNEFLPLLCVILAIFALPIVADAIQQYEMHKLYDEHQNYL